MKLWGFFANNAIRRRILDLWPLDLEIGPRGARVPGTFPTKFGLPRPFRFPSRWRHRTDRKTDGRNGRCHSNEVTRGKAARGPYDICQIWSWSVNRRWSYVDFLQTAQLAAVTLTFDLEIGPWGARVPGTLPTKFGIHRPFRFPSRWRHGTDRQTDRINTWQGLLLGRTAP